MKKEIKPCKRKKCPYYGYANCPYKERCEHSSDLVFIADTYNHHVRDKVF